LENLPEFAVTAAKRAWCKANVYVQSGQHAKAIYWLVRTQEILDGDRPPRRRRERLDAGYMLVAISALVLIWMSKP
jgi:hypothetical protein